jgi:uncharacterized protein YjbJ (UPF0337 family)
LTLADVNRILPGPERVRDLGSCALAQGAAAREETVMAKDTGPESAGKGLVEDIKGKAKEVIGEVTGDDSKEREGRAQQDKARSEREVAEHEAKADAARSEASMREAEQRVHQND